MKDSKPNLTSSATPERSAPRYTNPFEYDEVSERLTRLGMEGLRRAAERAQKDPFHREIVALRKDFPRYLAQWKARHSPAPANQPRVEAIREILQAKLDQLRDAGKVSPEQYEAIRSREKK